MMSSNNAGGGSSRFPGLALAVMAFGLGGSVAMREVALQTQMSAAAYWTGVVASGLVAGLGMSLFFPRFTRWTQARKESGRSSWWERLP